MDNIEALSAEHAQRLLRVHMDTIHGDTLRSRKLLGVMPASEPWPNTEAVEQPTRPPRNTPPSGSPGTPTARLEEQPVPAVAA